MNTREERKFARDMNRLPPRARDALMAMLGSTPNEYSVSVGGMYGIVWVMEDGSRLNHVEQFLLNASHRQRFRALISKLQGVIDGTVDSLWTVEKATENLLILEYIRAHCLIVAVD